MPLQLTTPPATEPVTLAEAKAHLKVDTTDDDALIGTLISAARSKAEWSTGRAFITQGWTLALDAWPDDGVFEIPFPPLQSVTSVMAYALETAVNSSFNAVASTIAAAAVSGKDSIGQMVDALLADFDRIAIKDFIAKPIEGVVADVASSLFGVSGGRAVGGPVTPGSTYLVGEQGPELFTPSENGAITSNANLAAPSRPSIVLNVNARDAQSFMKSETQIAAMMARALARGQRNM